MIHIDPLDIVSLMTDPEYESFKNVLIEARAIDPNNQLVHSLDYYNALSKSGVGTTLLDRHITVNAVDPNVTTANIEDLPNLKLHDKSYSVKVKKPLLLKQGSKLKLETFTVLVLQRLISLGYISSTSRRHSNEDGEQVTELIKYLTTHHLAEPVEISIHTSSKRTCVFFDNGHRLVPADTDRITDDTYMLTIGTNQQLSRLTTVPTSPKPTPALNDLTSTVNRIANKLKDYGINIVTLVKAL